MAENIKTEIYRPTADPGVYEAHVRALIDGDAALSDEQKADGDHTSIVVTFPKTIVNGKGEEKDATARHLRWFQDSAKALGVTARKVESIDQGDGTVNVRFIVVSKVTRPRKATSPVGASDGDSSTPVSDDAPKNIRKPVAA